MELIFQRTIHSIIVFVVLHEHKVALYLLGISLQKHSTGGEASGCSANHTGCKSFIQSKSVNRSTTPTSWAPLSDY